MNAIITEQSNRIIDHGYKDQFLGREDSLLGVEGLYQKPVREVPGLPRQKQTLLGDREYHL